MTGGNVEFTKEDLKQSYEKIFWELNEVQTGLDGKEKIEGLNGILTKTFSDELKKPENNKIKEALEKSFNTVKNNPDLSKRAGEGLQVLGVFFNGLSNEKVGDKAEADYKEFMEKLIKNPESLSRMTREEVARVKFYLQDKSHEKEACDMYKEIRKDVIDANKLQSLKGQDKEFTNEILACLKENYGKSDLFVEAEYKSKMEPKTEQLKKFVNGTWEGKDIEERDLKVVDNGIVDKEYLIKKFSEINKERSENNSKYVLENIKIDQEWLKNVQVSGADFDTALGYLLPNLSVQVMEFGRLGQIQLANEKEVGPILDNLKENIKNKFKTQFDQIAVNSTLGVEDGLLGNINKIVESGNEFIVKNGENVTYYPEKAADYLGILIGEKIGWNQLEGKPRNNGERQAWIAAVQVLLNSDKDLGNPIKVTGEYEAKVDDLTYKKVVEFQKKHGDRFSEGKRDGWGIDGKPGQNTISVLIEDQENREIEHNRLFGDIKGIGRFENGEFKFDDGVRKDGIATINGKQYKKYEDNMNELGYSTGQDKGEFGWDGDSYSYLFLGKFENGKREGEGTIYFTNGDVYQGFFKDGKVNGRGIYTRSNGNRYEGNWVDGKSMGTGKYETKDYSLVGEFDQVNKKITAGVQTFKDGGVVLQGDFLGEEYPFDKGNVFLNGNNYIVERDDKGLKITSGPKENIGKYIDEDSWTIVSGDQLSGVVITSDSGESSNNVVGSGNSGSVLGSQEEWLKEVNKYKQKTNNVQTPKYGTEDWYKKNDPEHVSDWDDGLKFAFISKKGSKLKTGIPDNSYVYTHKDYPNTYFYKSKGHDYIFLAVEKNYPFIKTQLTYSSKGKYKLSREFNVCYDGLNGLKVFLGGMKEPIQFEIDKDGIYCYERDPILLEHTGLEYKIFGKKIESQIK